MFYPLVYERVRVCDRAEEYVIRSVDYAARVADIHLPGQPQVLERGVPFDRLSAAAGSEPDSNGDQPRDRWVAATLRRLRAADSHMHRSSVLLADLHASLLTTMEAIRTSHQLIMASDRVIARARTLGCEELPNAGGE